TTPAGARYFLKNVATDDLLKMVPRTQAVYLELLFRKGVREEFRKEALVGLAKLEMKTEVAVLLEAIRLQDDAPASMEESVVYDLVRLLTTRPAKELAAVRADLEKLATSAKAAVTRQLGFIALVAADGNVDPAWKLGTKSVGALQDL